MFLSYSLFVLELKRNGWWKYFLDYRKFQRKRISHSLRISFLENCLRANIIPKFLKFRIPENGCFDDRIVEDFQLRLLRKELFKAKGEQQSVNEKLTKSRNALKQKINIKLLPSLILHIRIHNRLHEKEHTDKLNDKLTRLSSEQDKPLFNVDNTVICYQLDKNPPKYVLDTLALGPRNAVLGKFNKNDVLTELDDLIRFCRGQKVEEDVITDMNIKTLAYIKRCSKQKGSRNLQLTNRYLKENNLVALPFDKGIGICIMKVETYNNKMSEITDLPQFEKLVGRRKNEKHPMLKEEERVLSMLKLLKEDNKISDALYDKMKPVGSQPPRLYGLAKVHKKDTPVRPVLSMPGSAYYKIGNQVSKWLSVVKECNINSSTKEISDLLSQIQLNTNEELVSFDIKSLYTNVPLDEAINDCTELLFSGKYEQPPVDKETFKTLVSLCSRDVVLLSHDGYYKQIDGLAMGSPPAPLLANGWLSKFDSILKDDAVLYSRYMDDVLRNIERNRIDGKLLQINDLHPSLKFTIEKEGKNTSIPFLDMLIIRSNNNLSSTWYTKATDTGLTMNFHSLAPRKYKRSVVSGLVHRIHRACSTWSNFHQSLEKGKTVLEKNQYPKAFYDPIIKSTISKIMENNDNENPDEENEKEESEEKMIFIQYRGRVSEKFETSMRKLNIPCKIIFTLKKLKSSLPPLKPVIEKCFKSCLVYKIECPRCNSCYVGQTSRHLIKRLKEHKRTGPVGKHFDDCNNLLTMENVSILCSSTRNVYHLMTLEALMINYIKPVLNTKDEYRSRALIDDTLSSVIVAQLLFLQSESSKKPIHMYINSPGGSVTSGLAIYDTMQYIQPPIATWCVGQACSMGSLLLTSGAPGLRHALPHSRIMLHQPHGGVQGQATDIAIQAQEILKLKKLLNGIYSNHTGKDINTIEEALERDNFMSPEEAKSFGVVDHVLSAPVASSEPEEKS